MIGFIQDNKEYIYHKNIFGDIVAIYQGATKVAEYAYDAYGRNFIKVDIDGIATSNPFRYRGYFWDSDLSLYYLMSRYYDPATSRFINADTFDYLDSETIGGMNLYAYCGNNPVMYVDPSGHFPFFLLAALVGLVIGAGIGLGVGLSNGHTGWELVGDIVLGGLIGGFAGLVIGAGVSGLLTGSFFSSVGAVKTGAILTYQMARVGGLGAAMVMMGDNFCNAVYQTTHVFWSGGDLAMNGGNYLANDVGGKTLEMTNLGQYLTNNSASYETWRIASANFANQVSNGSTVFVIQNIQGISLTSTWAVTEYPILAKKAVEIIYEIIGGI